MCAFGGKRKQKKRNRLKWKKRREGKKEKIHILTPRVRTFFFVFCAIVVDFTFLKYIDFKCVSDCCL